MLPLRIFNVATVGFSWIFLETDLNVLKFELYNAFEEKFRKTADEIQNREGFTKCQCWNMLNLFFD